MAFHLARVIVVWFFLCLISPAGAATLCMANC